MGNPATTSIVICLDCMAMAFAEVPITELQPGSLLAAIIVANCNALSTVLTGYAFSKDNHKALELMRELRATLPKLKL